MERLEKAATVAAAAVGLTAYVYLLGGAVVWLRIYAAKLPADNATVAFQDRALLAVGIKVLLFELVLLALMTAVVWLIASGARWIERDGRSERELLTYVLRVLAASLVVSLTVIALLFNTFDVDVGAEDGVVMALIVLVGLLLAVLDLAGWPRWLHGLASGARKSSGEQKRSGISFGRAALSIIVLFVAVRYMAVALGLTVIVLVVLLELGRHVPLVPGGTGMRDLVRTGLILAAALNLIIVPYLATAPVAFDRATVTTTEGEELPGAFLGRNADGVFLATCVQRTPTKSMEGRIQMIPAEQVKKLVIGGFKYSFDVGNRPSLYALAHHVVVGDKLDRGDDGFLLDVREAPEVCGIKAPK